MAFTIGTNLDALNTYRNLSNTQNSLSSSLAKLSSGLRINNAGDDAAGLTIATALGSQVSGLHQASRNAQDGVSVVQTADGALSQAQSLLGRLRDLAVQAGNDSNSDSARTAITTEASSISAELGRLGRSVNFNGKNLLDGTAGTLNFQVGADGNGDNQIQVNLNAAGASANLVAVSNAVSATATGLTIGAVSPSKTAADVTKFNTTLTFSDASTGSTTTATITGGLNLGSAATVSDAVNALNANAAFSKSFAASVTTDGSGNQSVGIAARDGGTVTAKWTDPAANSGSGAPATLGGAGTVAAVSFDSAANAQSAIRTIQGQLDSVSAARANIGALENRFASAVSTISTSVTNLTAAKSRITDVDMASEMVNYSRANILSQSGTAMLAQANSLPQLVLKLIG